MDDCANAQYPPITGKLREKLAEYKPTEEGHTLTTYPVGQTGYARLVELCDTIDAIHARLEAAYGRLRAERDSMAAALDRAEGEHDFAPESHYMMLPKDADGEPIHIGDVMEWCDSGDTIVVEGIGNDTLFYIDNGLAEWTAARNKRHHNPDTWERIIEDALDGYHDTDFDKLVARCKALAGDAE